MLKVDECLSRDVLTNAGAWLDRTEGCTLRMVMIEHSPESGPCTVVLSDKDTEEVFLCLGVKAWGQVCAFLIEAANARRNFIVQRAKNATGEEIAGAMLTAAAVREDV